MFSQLAKLSLIYNTCYENVIIIFPGFGIHPENYYDLFPKNIEKIPIHLWEDSELDYIIKNVDKPGSISYFKWFNRKIYLSKKEFLEKTKDLTYVKNFIYFSHSLGSEFAKKLSKYSTKMITYGGIIKDNKNTTFNIIGSEDKTIYKYFKKIPENTTIIKDGNHFSCVDESSQKRSMQWREKINIHETFEPYITKKQKIIKKQLQKKIANIINS
tara:strand:- start:220 stop:861 length:642 start_codon:yes stop_codon:yes gene_type:complete